MRKIIHIDMDCFYAAIEVRDRPELRGKPVAVGGRSRRGVLTTCSYEARRFGCRSAMPTFKALRLCPELIVLPVRFDAYRRESRIIRGIFGEFTELVEPLSLDEAYLDVSHLRSSGAAVAREIRDRIRHRTGLTASAGIAPNKLLAKIASDWRKPDGQFEIAEHEIGGFMRPLPVRRLWGVGGKTADRLAEIGVTTCGDLQRISRTELATRFGKFGVALHDLCRGIDERPVSPDRIRKSLSNERTFADNLTSLEACREKLDELLDDQEKDLGRAEVGRRIIKAVVKLKFADFRQTTVECVVDGFDRTVYPALLGTGWARGGGRPVRLLGVGVRFADEEPAGSGDDAQLEMPLGES